MRYILTLAFLFLMVGVSHAQQVSYAMPIPAPTTPPTIMFDSYGGITSKAEKTRLQRFAAELKKDDYLLKNAQGHIISYGGKRTYLGEALKRAERVKRYLVEKEGLEPARLLIIDGGYRESWTIELYIVPPGAGNPKASPTVNSSDVKVVRREKRRTQNHGKPRLTTHSTGAEIGRLSFARIECLIHRVPPG